MPLSSWLPGLTVWDLEWLGSVDFGHWFITPFRGLLNWESRQWDQIFISWNSNQTYNWWDSSEAWGVPTTEGRETSGENLGRGRTHLKLIQGRCQLLLLRREDSVLLSSLRNVSRYRAEVGKVINMWSSHPRKDVNIMYILHADLFLLCMGQVFSLIPGTMLTLFFFLILKKNLKAVSMNWFFYFIFTWKVNEWSGTSFLWLVQQVFPRLNTLTYIFIYPS